MYNSALVFNPSDGTSRRFSVPVVQELPFQHLEMPPQRYVRSEEERPCPSPANNFPERGIPVIDMDILFGEQQCRQKEMEKLAIACQEWGFFQVMSNGRYTSIEHRAVTNMYRDRISIAMFYSPSPDTEVGPAPELIDESHPCKYRRFIRGDYMWHYTSNKLDGKKTIEFAKI